MNSLSLSTTDKEMFIQIIQQSSRPIKDEFVNIGGKLTDLSTQKRKYSSHRDDPNLEVKSYHKLKRHHNHVTMPPPSIIIIIIMLSLSIIIIIIM